MNRLLTVRTVSIAEWRLTTSTCTSTAGGPLRRRPTGSPSSRQAPRKPFDLRVASPFGQRVAAPATLAPAGFDDQSNGPERHRDAAETNRSREPLGLVRYSKTSSALVAQGIEHGSPKAGVAGSNPAGGTSEAVFQDRRRRVDVYSSFMVRSNRSATCVVARIVAERNNGAGVRGIAAALNADGVPTARGGAQWYASTVQRVLDGQDAAKLRATA
jgi:hypothetical protein